MASRKCSKDEEINLGEMFEALEEQQKELELRSRTFDLVPPGWRPVERGAKVTPKRTKLKRGFIAPDSSNREYGVPGLTRDLP